MLHLFGSKWPMAEIALLWLWLWVILKFHFVLSCLWWFAWWGARMVVAMAQQVPYWRLMWRIFTVFCFSVRWSVALGWNLYKPTGFMFSRLCPVFNNNVPQTDSSFPNKDFEKVHSPTKTSKRAGIYFMHRASTAPGMRSIQNDIVPRKGTKVMKIRSKVTQNWKFRKNSTPVYWMITKGQD